MSVQVHRYLHLSVGRRVWGAAAELSDSERELDVSSGQKLLDPKDGSGRWRLPVSEKRGSFDRFRTLRTL